MSLLKSILVPLDGSEASMQSLGCAMWLASRLQAQLHVLNAGAEAPATADMLARLRLPKEAGSLITVHQGVRDAKVEILEAVERYAIDLIAMTARGGASDLSAGGKAAERSKIVGHVTQAIIEESRVPVLLIPPCYEQALPWKTVLVPMSGEARTDASLMLAVQLGKALHLKVSIVHVVDLETADASARAIGCYCEHCYCDQAHHECPQMLNEFITRACPFCSVEEKRCINEFALVQGDVTTEVLRRAKERKFSLIVVGWHGHFVGEHARVLKSLCGTVTAPVLLVRPSEKATFKLKVGEEFEP